MSIWHILPNNDLKLHEESSACDCQPRVEWQENGDLILIHNAYDGREGLEMALEILK